MGQDKGTGFGVSGTMIPQGQADAHRQDAKGHNVRQRIDLNAKVLHGFGSILLGPGHLPIEGVAQAGQQKE